MPAFRVILRSRCLAEPEVVVELGGHGNFFERAAANAGGHKHIHMFQLADAPIANQFTGEVKAFTAALLGAGLENDLIIAHGFDHVPPLVNRECQRLLAIDILFGLGGGDVDERVPMIGGGLHHGVNVPALQQFSEVAILCRRLPVFREPLHGVVRASLIYVTHGYDVPKTRCVLRVHLAHAAAADERDA